MSAGESSTCFQKKVRNSVSGAGTKVGEANAWFSITRSGTLPLAHAGHHLVPQADDNQFSRCRAEEFKECSTGFRWIAFF